MDENHLHSEIRKLKKDKEKLQGFLTLACIALGIFVLLYFSANSMSTKQQKMIDTCISDVDALNSTLTDANNAVGSMSQELDSISTDASNAAGSDYDNQASTLDDISSRANDASQNNDFSPPATTCAQVDNGNTSSQ